MAISSQEYSPIFGLVLFINMLMFINTSVFCWFSEENDSSSVYKEGTPLFPVEQGLKSKNRGFIGTL
ncbi:hypothetical protein HYU19_03165 [Candidatus Woesearchaeota archaeon]|nr:hypothetical protein [Candidatus Woesearchaeota archaeon]